MSCPDTIKIGSTTYRCDRENTSHTDQHVAIIERDDANITILWAREEA
jgi:hypothetical protein